ncbi:MAG: class II D-tagatose-bisphosphate aldolase, non-catalytic subunit, partial [Spirochaetota bacterium]
MKRATRIFLKTLQENKQGLRKGIYSICSAHPYVIEAGMRQAAKDNSLLLIESTSNQVNQFGGYTGMKPEDFVDYVGQIAVRIDFPVTGILFGGDHLGPNVWQSLPSEQAMLRAKEIVSAYVKAGYIKIHLDASMRCADDPSDNLNSLPDEVAAERTAELCEAAEKAWAENSGGTEKPLYVIGTEVPVPGGAKVTESELEATRVENVKRTLDLTRQAFAGRELNEAWNRVIGIVVQPGVEFGDD